VPKGTSQTLEEFFNADDASQRAVFDEPAVSINFSNLMNFE